jgi:prephenate dehydratase
MTTYAYLGPRGTFTEAALLAMPESEGAELLPVSSVAVALDLVRAGEVTGALVPIENSVEGSVPTTLDELSHGTTLQIVDEIAIPVQFALLVRRGTSLNDIKRIATHPHAHAQCSGWIAENLPGVHVLPAMSTAAAAAELTEDSNYQAAIASTAAAGHYGLEILVDGIADKSAAWTRFILVRRQGHALPPSGNDKTTLSLFMHEDHPGALLEILTEFSLRGVNLTRIESRPTRKQLGDYYFSIDCEGHIDEEHVGEALKGLHRICADVKFLGSYPRHEAHIADNESFIVEQEFADADQWLAAIRDRASD